MGFLLSNEGVPVGVRFHLWLPFSTIPKEAKYNRPSQAQAGCRGTPSILGACENYLHTSHHKFLQDQPRQKPPKSQARLPGCAGCSRKCAGTRLRGVMSQTLATCRQAAHPRSSSALRNSNRVVTRWCFPPGVYTHLTFKKT